MRTIKVIFWLIGLQCLCGIAYAQSITVKAMRFSAQSAEARMVFDVTGTPVQDVVLLQNPTRLVINFENAKLDHKIGQPAAANAFLSGIYTTASNDSRLEITIELKKNISFKSFVLKPGKGYGPRLVIDIFDAPVSTITANTQPIRQDVINNSIRNNGKFAEVSSSVERNPVKIAQNAAIQSFSNKYLPKPDSKVEVLEQSKSKQMLIQPKQRDNDTVAGKRPENSVAFGSVSESKTNRKITGKTQASSAREIVIAIDAGHGGEDSGARGPGGTEEKQVVFQIAKKLENLIARQPGMKPVLVRDGDYFIKLRNRMQIARVAKADLFVSIHADAFTNDSAKGASVYTLSSHGASSEAARWLADNENAADLVGGVSLDDKDDMLASVLLDLSQTATTEASSNVAKKVLANFRNIHPLHKASVQKAGFVVLKSPDIPSILVETAFISNPAEERKLRSEVHQLKVARAIFNGIVTYFKQNIPLAPSLRIAKASQAPDKPDTTKHAVSRGETLSGIAQQYGVTMRELKSANMMNTGLVRVGQVLRIPVDS